MIDLIAEWGKLHRKWAKSVKLGIPTQPKPGSTQAWAPWVRLIHRNIFTLIQRRHLHLEKCPVCEWRKNVRKLTNRNKNQSICGAKGRANLWKTCHDIPLIAPFSLDHYHQQLQVQFTAHAQMYLFRNETKEIDIRVRENK